MDQTVINLQEAFIGPKSCSKEDCSLGMFLGSCIGDSAGALLEIPLRNEIPLHQVQCAISLPGGGAHRLGPGQVTDVAEMSITLGYALSTSCPPLFPADSVAKHFAWWIASRPFTVKKECRAAGTAAVKVLQTNEAVSVAHKMAKASLKTNASSQANGALLRAVPLAIWGHNLDDDQLANCAIQDCLLTHPHDNCKACSAIFCVALKHLINNPGNAQAAILAAHGFAMKFASPEVLTWLQEALALGEPPSVTQAGSASWVRWPFIYAFRHLKKESSLEEALRESLVKGGACSAIGAAVGAMAGALHGFINIPENLRSPVLSRGPLSPGNPRFPRPPWLHTRILPSLCHQLLGASHATKACEVSTPDKTSSR